ncbi:hypothetical protein HYPSUDRAFT_59837 [Hypholoma sublateritium FD-334 SS-4]|uniref:Uncharacterized protein n=1 Tax=Hypholoma sublateritium (strain FD-334 SS-4) TaxID=945553 RepID=A0A0D2NAA4_HYPSF|nr:hypothetical protein HYPSUDRAFT_59837 [Hypholoma sublateritium FD-334 SS-4]
MSCIRLSLPEDALRVLIFIVRQLELEISRLQTVADEREHRFRALEDKHEAMLDESFTEAYHLHQRCEAEEIKNRALTDDFERAVISNNRLEADNEELRLDNATLKCRLSEQ